MSPISETRGNRDRGAFIESAGRKSGKERLQELFSEMEKSGLSDGSEREIQHTRLERMPETLCDLVCSTVNIAPEIFSAQQTDTKPGGRREQLLRLWHTLEYLDKLDIVTDAESGKWSIGFIPDLATPPDALPLDQDSWNEYRSEQPAAQQTRIVQTAILRPDICSIREVGGRVFVIGLSKSRND